MRAKNGFVVGMVLCAGTASAQVERWKRSGDVQGQIMGQTVVAVGDVDGDGMEDVAVGSPEYNFSFPDAGHVEVFSGADGTLLSQMSGREDQDLGRAIAPAGDLDGDGVCDFWIAGPGESSATRDGVVQLRSGKTGALRAQIQGTDFHEHFGNSIGGGVDLDGDGVPDLAVGAPNYGGSLHEYGRVQVYSGLDFSLLWEVIGPADDLHLGVVVTTVPDLDGDGRGEVIASMIGNNPNEDDRVWVLAGADGSLLHELRGAQAEGSFGASLASLGDMDGDGVAEFAIGSPGADFGVGFFSGAVYVYSGASVDLLHLVVGDRKDRWTGIWVASARDVDGDGRDDLLVGEHWQARLVGGQFGRDLYHFAPQDGDARRFGSSMAGLFDHRDGLADVVIGAPEEVAEGDVRRAGSVTAFSGAALYLDLLPAVVHANESVSFGLGPSERGLPYLLLVLEIDGAPFWYPLFVGRFGRDGMAENTADVPPGLEGTHLTFAGLGLDRHGKLVLTAPATLSIEFKT